MGTEICRMESSMIASHAWSCDESPSSAFYLISGER